MQVLKEPGMAATSTRWMWVLRGGPPDRAVVTFNYDKSRGGAVVERLLERFAGRYFQSDGYVGYDRPCEAKGVVHLGCMDHARRKVVEAVRAQPKGAAHGKASVAQVMLSKINALYRLERELAELDDDERYAARQRRAIPMLKSLHTWLDEKQPKVAPDTLTRKTINYALNQWDHLARYPVDFTIPEQCRDTGVWRFRQLAPGDLHEVATALRCDAGTDGPVSLKMHSIDPLREHEELSFPIASRDAAGLS